MEKVLLKQEDLGVKKILVTGNKVHWKEELGHIISINGHQVVWETKPNKGEFFQEDPAFDLVVINQQEPPEMDELSSLIKSLRPYKKIPTLMFSLYPPQLEVTKALMMEGIFVEKYRSISQSISAINLLVSFGAHNTRFVNWFRSRNLRPVIARKGSKAVK